MHIEKGAKRGSGILEGGGVSAPSNRQTLIATRLGQHVVLSHTGWSLSLRALEGKEDVSIRLAGTRNQFPAFFA